MSSSYRGVQREHSLDGDVHCWGVEGLEHDLCHLLTVGLGVEGGLSEQDWVLLRGNTELIVDVICIKRHFFVKCTHCYAELLFKTCSIRVRYNTLVRYM